MSETVNPLEAGRKQYYAARQPNEINVVNAVRDILVSSGLAIKVRDVFDQNPTIQAAQDKNASTQRYILNRYWTLQLQSSVKDTEQLRFYLFPEGSVDDWLLSFRTAIVPFLLENDLPQPIHG